MTFALGSTSNEPTATIRSPRTATSARRPGAPVPSISVPPFRTRSAAMRGCSLSSACADGGFGLWPISNPLAAAFASIAVSVIRHSRAAPQILPVKDRCRKLISALTNWGSSAKSRGIVEIKSATPVVNHRTHNI